MRQTISIVRRVRSTTPANFCSPKVPKTLFFSELLLAPGQTLRHAHEQRERDDEAQEAAGVRPVQGQSQKRDTQDRERTTSLLVLTPSTRTRGQAKRVLCHPDPNGCPRCLEKGFE